MGANAQYFRFVWGRIAAWLWLAGILACSASGQSPLPQDAGKLIYSKGESPSQSTLEAILGDTTVPATLMPCSNCHGADGKGRTEGGVIPSDITWNALIRPREADTALGRRRPAYDAALLRKVMREGVDPAGNELGIVMPRYRISDADLNHLIAFLRELGVKSDPGVTSTTVHAAALVPSTGPLVEAGAGAAELVRAYFEELNQQGGIYGRKIQFDIVQTRDTPAETAAALEDFVRSRQVFALAGVLAPGAERAVADALENTGVPAIDTFPHEGRDRLLVKARVFHLLPGLSSQTRALVRFAHDRSRKSASSVAIIAPHDRRELAATVEEECRLHGWPAESLDYARFDAAEIVGRLAARQTWGVIFLGQGAELKSLLAAAEQHNWQPQIFQPGILAGDEVFRVSPDASERVFFSFATLPSDIAPEAFAEYKFLLAKYKIKPVHPAQALAALAAAKLFAEGLKQSGRDLTREGFVDALAALYNFNTGLTPPLSYGATRRTGALGAYIVRLDAKGNTLVPAGGWIEAGR